VAPFEQVCVPEDNVGCIKSGSIPHLSTSPGLLTFASSSGIGIYQQRSTDINRHQGHIMYVLIQRHRDPGRTTTTNAPLASTVDTHTSTSRRKLFALRSMLYRRQN
jgi:hypothetical protein